MHADGDGAAGARAARAHRAPARSSCGCCFALIFARGAVNAVDNPARQAFLVELVGPERLVNAVSLGSALVNGARTIGPALAGVVIATVGVEPCFALNALSFARDDRSRCAGWTRPRCAASPPAARRRGQVRSARCATCARRRSCGSRSR